MGGYLLQSKGFGSKGNFEVLLSDARIGLQHWWRNNDAQNVDTAWAQGNQGNPIVGSVISMPALIQSNFGSKGNFDVVVPQGSGLQHWWRNNDAQNVDTAWAQGNQRRIITSQVIESPALIQSKGFGSKGNFEVLLSIFSESQEF